MNCPALCHVLNPGVLASGGVGLAWTSWTESWGETVSSNGEDVEADFKRAVVHYFYVLIFSYATCLVKLKWKCQLPLKKQGNENRVRSIKVKWLFLYMASQKEYKLYMDGVNIKLFFCLVGFLPFQYVKCLYKLKILFLVPQRFWFMVTCQILCFMEWCISGMLNVLFIEKSICFWFALVHFHYWSRNYIPCL